MNKRARRRETIRRKRSVDGKNPERPPIPRGNRHQALSPAINRRLILSAQRSAQSCFDLPSTPCLSLTIVVLEAIGIASVARMFVGAAVFRARAVCDLWPCVLFLSLPLSFPPLLQRMTSDSGEGSSSTHQQQRSLCYATLASESLEHSGRQPTTTAGGGREGKPERE